MIIAIPYKPASRRKASDLAQELTLIAKAQGGDTAARNALVTVYTPLFWKLARRIRARGLDLDDLFQLAVVEFLAALDHYDPARSSFITFLYLYIPHHLQRAAMQHGLIWLPAGATRRGSTRAYADHAITGGAALNDRDYLEAPAWEEMDPAQRYEVIEEGQATLRFTRRAVKAIDALPYRRAFVVRARYLQGQTLAQVGARLGVTRERVRQIELKAIEALRKILKVPA